MFICGVFGGRRLDLRQVRLGAFFSRGLQIGGFP